jgi:O-antigen/teichoic acid export membrane protein
LSKNISSISTPPPNEIQSTEGMTTKVVKGSLWTLAGTILPFLVTFFATPFIIRFLGSEGYGVLLLIGLIPNYFIFADFGMGVASTKFGSEAYSQGLSQKEGKIVHTAALIALIFSLPMALSLFFFSSFIITFLKVSEYWHGHASIGLKITSLIFVIGILGGIFNTPQLSRLRMDLNSLVNTVSRILMPLGTIIALYFGGGIVWAAVASLFAISVALVGHIFFSGRLLPEIFQINFDKNLIKPMLKFGSGLMLASVAVTTLVNLEKFTLSSLISVQSLAYYSVAFTFANMTTMFSGAMIQSLVPAFSQLQAPEKKSQFNSLFSRSMRLNLIWLCPAMMFLFVIANPFFTIWAGPEFGKESSVPFYILLIGLFFQVLAYIPHSAITAFGRTDALAKLYWFELLICVPITILLVYFYGIKGAAMAWSFRAALDTLIIVFLARNIAGVPLTFFSDLSKLGLGMLILSPPMLLAFFYDNYSLWLMALIPISLILYSFFIWKILIEEDERNWITDRIEKLWQVRK